MRNELFIYDEISGWLDTSVVCGMSLEDGALSALMAPPSLKDCPSNVSRIEHGTRYLPYTARFAERNITIPFHILAESNADLYSKYEALCALLSKGEVMLKTKYNPNVVYKLIYQSCSQWSQYDGRIALFSLKFVEPDPTNRTL